MDRVRKRNWKDKKNYNVEVAKKLNEAFTLLGIDTESENFKGTDRRLTQVMEDFTYAKTEEGKEELDYLFTRKFESNYTGMVVLNPIKVYGMCPHHILPVTYIINFAYVPRKYVLGLSKIYDIIKLICMYPDLQEDLTDNIANIFMRKLNAKGVMIIVNGEHSCMQVRDSEARETSTITSCIRGVYENEDTKNEFLSLIKNGKS